MEKTLTLAKLIAISAFIVAAILCLSVENAYGMVTSLSLSCPSQTEVTGTPNPDNGQSITNEVIGSGDIVWTCDDGLITDGQTERPSCVPEPASLLLLGVGLAGVRLLRRRG